MRIRSLPGLLALMFSLLLAGCGGSASGEGSDATSSEAAKVYRWKMVMAWPKNFPGLGTGAEKFARHVEAMSGGRIKIHIYGAGELVPALEVFDAVSQGTAEIGHSAAYYWKGKVPASVFFTSVPFGMTTMETNAWLFYGGGLELWREAYAPFNIIPFAAGNTGVQMAGWFNKEINSLADLKGLKMRIPGLGGEVFQRVGGQPINIPGSELYISMETGVIDAVEWVGPYNDLAFGFQSLGKTQHSLRYYYPAWQEPTGTLEILVNKKAFESLPPDLQAIVEVAARAANQDMLDEYVAYSARAYHDLQNKHGIDIRPLPTDMMAHLKKETESVLQKIAASDELAGRVYASQKAFMESLVPYQRITEEAYIELRKALEAPAE
ncbi:MAG TPA: TRAP transporter substrate-binding protein [Porticoccaceae bacterium]